MGWVVTHKCCFASDNYHNHNSPRLAHTQTHTLTCTAMSPQPQPGAPTTTTTSAYNCLPICHTHVHTQAVHMRRRAWQKLRKKKRSDLHGTDKLGIVYLYSWIRINTHTSTRSQHIPLSLPLIFSFNAIIINSGKGKTKHTSQISLLDIYFLFLGFFNLLLGWDIFAEPLAPSFSLLFSKSCSHIQV